MAAKPDKVRVWIVTGMIKAVNVASKPGVGGPATGFLARSWRTFRLGRQRSCCRRRYHGLSVHGRLRIFSPKWTVSGQPTSTTAGDPMNLRCLWPPLHGTTHGRSRWPKDTSVNDSGQRSDQESEQYMPRYRPIPNRKFSYGIFTTW